MGGEIELKKVEGANNLADALTKYVEQDGINKHLEGTNQRLEAGRHQIMPEIAKDE